LSDLGAMVGGLVFAAHGPGSEHSLTEFLSLRLTPLNCALLLCMLGCWHACFRALGLYRRPPLFSGSRLLGAALATSPGVGLLAVAGPLLEIGFVNRRFLFQFWLTALAGVLALRGALAAGRSLVGGDALHQRRVLIVGSGSRALQLAEPLERDPD